MQEPDMFNQQSVLERPIFPILRKRLDALKLEDQMLFMDVALSWTEKIELMQWSGV